MVAEQQDGRRQEVISLLEQARQEGSAINFAQIAKAVGYADSGGVWKIYHRLMKQGVLLPPIARNERAKERKVRTAQARGAENPLPFRELARELGMGEAAVRSLASKIGATETVLTSEEAKVFREKILRMWQEGLDQKDMIPLLQSMGYKATEGQLSGAFHVLREEGKISKEPAKIRRKKRREERFLKEILSDKDALQICDDMKITTRVFELLERKLRGKIKEQVGDNENLQRSVSAKIEQILEIERAKTRKQPNIQQETQQQPATKQPREQQPMPSKSRILAPDQEKRPPSVEEKQRLENKKNQIRDHLILLRQNGGIVITGGPVYVAETEPMGQFETLNNISYDFLRSGMRGAPATKLNLPMYRRTKDKLPVTPPTTFSVIVNKQYQYNPDAPDPQGINDLLWKNLAVFVDKLLQSTGVDYTDEDKYSVLDAFFST